MTVRIVRFGAPILGLVLSVLLSSVAWGMECQDLPLMQLRLQDGTVVQIFALDEQINGTKAWDMNETSDPPLPLSKALRIAQNWAAKNYPGFDQIRIGRISLNERRCGFSRGRWFYVFDFDPVKDGKLQLGTEHFVAILMDGRVIPPGDAPASN